MHLIVLRVHGPNYQTRLVDDVLIDKVRHCVLQDVLVLFIDQLATVAQLTYQVLHQPHGQCVLLSCRLTYLFKDLHRDLKVVR